MMLVLPVNEELLTGGTDVPIELLILFATYDNVAICAGYATSSPILAFVLDGLLEVPLINTGLFSGA
jgi:hypothetical protein